MVTHDVRYAWRHIRRSPGFAAAAILTLALGIGANTAMFSMLNALTMTRLAIDDPDGLIAIMPQNSRGLARSTPVPAVDVLSRQGPLEHVCGYLGGVVLPVLANEVPIQTLTTFVTGECFNAFRVSPILGRAIAESDAPIYGAGAHIAVISHRLWRNTFNGDPRILDRSLLVNNVDVAIVGVLPPGFGGLEVDHGVDVFTPFDAVLPATAARRQLAGTILGRLRPGVTLDQAAAEVQARWPAVLDAAVPSTLPPSERAALRDSVPRLERIGTGVSNNRQRYARPLTLVLGLTALLLLLACVNLGGLLLARVTARSSELSVRLALGGTRWRIARQMLIESLLVSMSGAVLGIPLAFALVTTLVSFMPPLNVPYAMSFTPDWRVLAVTSLAGVAVGVLISAVPVCLAMRRRDHSSVSERTIAGTSNRWGRGLLVAQIALSVVLLTGASLLTRSLYLLTHTELGIRTSGILNVKLVGLPNAPYTRAGRETYYPPLLERISALPGVTSVALSLVFPRGLNIGSTPIAFVGEDFRGVAAASDRISPAFFDTLGIALLAGRTIAWSDTLKTPQIAVVSESLARALSPDGQVLDRHVRFGSVPADQDITIVGVVRDATNGDPRNTKPLILYRPALQIGPEAALNPNLLVATSDPATTAAGVRTILREGGRDYAREIVGLDDVLARAPAGERMSVTVAAAVGGLAVLLALIGVHGALAYSVSRRRREIGIRVAIGATRAAVARGIIREGLTLTALGIAIGVPLALAAARSLKSLLYGISEVDPVTFTAVAVFFLALGAAAGFIPARRASTVDPIAALRPD